MRAPVVLFVSWNQWVVGYIFGGCHVTPRLVYHYCSAPVLNPYKGDPESRTPECNAIGTPRREMFIICLFPAYSNLCVKNLALILLHH